MAPLHDFEFVRVELSHGDHRCLGDFSEIPHQVRTPVAVADDSDFDHVLSTPRCSRSRVSPITRAGTPATIAYRGTSSVTTAPAPTRAPSPIVMAPMTVALDPMEAPRSTRVFSTIQSRSVCGLPSGLVARGKRSFVNMTPWPMKTSSSILTPSQMKVCEEILQRAPTMAFFCISTNAPIFVPAPMVQP